MKNILTLLLFCIAFNSGFAQSNIKYKHEFGFNVNVLLNSLLFDNSNGTESLFVPQDILTGATYRLYTSPNFAYRFGVGIFNNTKSDSTVNNFFSAVDNYKVIFFGAQLGIQKRFNISKRVKPFIGIEYLFRYEKNSVEHIEEGSSFGFGAPDWQYTIKTTDFINRHGLGIPIGFQIFISDRISISTESNLEFIFEKRKNQHKETSNQTNSNTYTNDFKTNSLSSRLPMAVLISFGF